MAIKDYIVASDKFEPSRPISVESYDFPCCACEYRYRNQDAEPCNKCGHNMNAELESE